jgi:hypothetical protein
MQNLGFQVAKAITGDGRTIVGSDLGPYGGSVAVIWDADDGVRGLREYLIKEHGLASALVGWKLTSALDISSDGRTIVGFGENPEGRREPWVFTASNVSVPEPTTLAMLIAVVAGWYQRSRAA